MLTWSEAPRTKGQPEDIEKWDGKLGAFHCAFLSGRDTWRVMVWLHWKEVKTLRFSSRAEAMASAEAEIARELDAMGLQLKHAGG